MDKKLFLGVRPSKSTANFATHMKEYPSRKEDYDLLEKIGRGVTATVWRAKCIPLDVIVAVKVLDLETMNVQMEEIIHEAQTMSLYHHPNLLSMYTSFVVGKDLWFIEPFIDGGSVFNIMRYKHPNGLDESAIAVIMKEVAKALEYVHSSGGIHRDVKAGNILIKSDGTVLLADFGVAATMSRGGSWGNDRVSRKTFAGTPCWMAPEVMEQTDGYDNKADVWSFGITMLELAHGRAPFAKFSPIKVLLMTIQNPPPQLEAEDGKRTFSRHMKELVAQCLQKDPKMRPTAGQLLEFKFLKNAPDTKYLASHLVKALPQLAQRAKMLDDFRGSRSSEDGSGCDSSGIKREFVRGMSGWNFDVHDKSMDSDLPGSPSRFELKIDSPKATIDVPAEESTPGLSAKPSAVSIKDDKSTSSPKLDAAVLSPIKKKTEHHSTTDSSIPQKHSSHDKNGKVESSSGDENVIVKKASVIPETGSTLDQPSQTTHTKTEDVSTTASHGDVTEPEVEPHKTVVIGRFIVSDQVVTKKDNGKNDRPKPEIFNSSVPPATILSSQLQSLLSRQRQMYASVERMVEAVKEADAGNLAALQTFASTVDPDSEALLQRIKELESENKSLKERNQNLEQQLSALTSSNGPASLHQNKP